MDKLNIKITPHGIAKSQDVQKMADAIDMLIGMFGSISQQEYDDMSSYDDRLYFIRDDRHRLNRVYYGASIIAMRAREGQQINLGFPYELPILF